MQAIAEVAASRMLRINDQREEEISYKIIEPKASFKTFAAHIRTTFRCKRKGREDEDRIMNLQFFKSYGFYILYYSLCDISFLLMYIIRLATDPAWNSGCTGCELLESDIIFNIVLIALVRSTEP